MKSQMIETMLIETMLIEIAKQEAQKAYDAYQRGEAETIDLNAIRAMEKGKRAERRASIAKDKAKRRLEF